MNILPEAIGGAVGSPVELQARKPGRVRLDAEMTSAQSLSYIAAQNTADLTHNLQVFLMTGNAASVHKSRVSMRRLRVLCKGIKPWMAPRTYNSLTTNLKAAMAILHPLRQHDVVMGWLDAGGIDTAEMQFERLHMSGAARAQIANDKVIDCADDFAELMKSENWRRRDAKTLDKSTLHILPGIIDEAMASLYRHGDLAQVLKTTGDYHTFRKDLKRLRYWLEFTRSLFDKRDIAPWRKTCKALQTSLGTINDLDEARMTGYDRLLAGGAWGPGRSEAVDLAEGLSDTLKVLPKFWRRTLRLPSNPANVRVK